MSVINSFVQNGRAYLFADRALTDHDGLLTGTMSKFIKGVQFPWVMTYSGHGEGVHEVPGDIVFRLGFYSCGTPRKLAEALRDVLREISAARPGLSFGLHVGAWSGKLGRAVLFFVANDDIHFPGLLTAYQLAEGSHVIQGTRTIAEYMGRDVDFEDPKSFNPLLDGVTLMQAQRRLERFERAYDVHAHRIGGACEVAIVGRRGVRFETLWVWPDEIGELIDPVRTPGMSLAQDR